MCVCVRLRVMARFYTVEGKKNLQYLAQMSVRSDWMVCTAHSVEREQREDEKREKRKGI